MAKYENPAELDYRNGGDTVDDFAQKYMRTVDYIIKALNDLRTPTGNTAGVEPEPYMWRIADNKLYIRNGDNTDYVLLGEISPNFGFRQSVNDRFLTTADLEGEGAVVTRNEAGKVEGDITGSPGKIAGKTIDVTPSADNDVIAYDAAQQKWVKKTLNDYLKKQGDAGWDEMVDEVADQVINDITPIIFNFWYLDDDGYLVPLVGSTEGGLPSIHGMVGDYEQITARRVDVAGNLSATGNVTAGMVTTPQANVTTLTANAVNAGTLTANDIIAKGPIVDVRAFGAKGDGVTDDTQAIQAAINNSNNIFIPAGVYNISKPLVITKSYVKIKGCGEQTQIKKTTNDGVAITRTFDEETVDFSTINAIFDIIPYSNQNISYVKICDMELSNANLGIYARYATYCVFENIRMTSVSTSILIGQWCNTIRHFRIFNAGTVSLQVVNCIDLLLDNIISNIGTLEVYKSSVNINHCVFDNGNPSFLLKDSSAVMTGCGCETVYSFLNTENSIVAINGGNFEEHTDQQLGDIRYDFITATKNSKVIVNSALFYLANYYDIQIDTNKNIFTADSSDVKINGSKINIPYDIKVYVADSDGIGALLQVGKEVWSKNSKEASIHDITGHGIGDIDLVTLGTAYRKHQTIKLKGYASYYDTYVDIDVTFLVIGNSSTDPVKVIDNSEVVSKEGYQITPSFSFTRTSEEIVIKMNIDNNKDFTYEITYEVYDM